MLTEWAIDFAITGPIIPGRVPALLVIPIKTPENLGAMSMWLTQCPAREKPPRPTPSETRVIATGFEVPRYPARIKKMALKNKAKMKRKKTINSETGKFNAVEILTVLTIE